MKSWEGDEVGFVKRFESVDSVTNLLDMDCTGKGCFLRIVSLKLEKADISAFGWVGLRRYTCTPCLSFVMR